MTNVWILEPAAAAEDAVWQGRPLMKIAVSASSAAFARLAADKWASLQSYCHDRRPGFENQLLYYARGGKIEGHLQEVSVRLLDGQILSIGAQNERWGPSVGRVIM